MPTGGVAAALRVQRLAGNRATAGLLGVQRDASGVTVQRSPLSAEEIAGLTLPQVEARIAENEAEAAPLVVSPGHLAVLGEEHIRLSRRYDCEDHVVPLRVGGLTRATTDQVSLV
ncbi:hypothetical protein FHX81_1473 [Saccharothrix saharensis]|uniref:Uncharacterized protein n=1 Tax=Saccharothrix saharensis TaxID=571190 RepID=A0A543J8N3_9PSEU|nr:hypothetical protein FHX81_1473 [Saccharothrix saharensis]